MAPKGKHPGGRPTTLTARKTFVGGKYWRGDMAKYFIYCGLMLGGSALIWFLLFLFVKYGLGV